jgi:hypothetical protein
MLLLSSLSADPVPLQRATTPVSEIPVGALVSSYPPKGTIWVRATIIEQTGDDTYLIKDKTGRITLFLPLDSLMELDLRPGMEILIFGTVDVSGVRPDKNEFYAERILLPPLKPG